MIRSLLLALSLLLFTACEQTNLYRDAAEAIAARIAGVEPDPLALHFPTSADGLAGALFIDAAIRSSDDETWVQVPSA